MVAVLGCSSFMITIKSNLVIAVDLDGTLIKTDLLVESLCKFLIQRPQSLFILFYWFFMGGKAHLKSKLAEAVEIDPAVLPYNKGLLAWLVEQKKTGIKLVLATASDQRYAQKIANHLGIFQSVFGSKDGINLKSINKRDLLVSVYGEKSFCYVGDSKADLPIWASSKEIYVVGRCAAIEKGLHKLGLKSVVFSSEKPPIFMSFAKSLRPHQWLKNLLIFVPLFLTQEYLNPVAITQAIFAFLLFSFMASSAYVLNDLIDVESDRHHPSKKNRPFAAGDLNLMVGLISFPILLLLSFGLAQIFLPVYFVATLFLYFLITIGYSFWFKKIVLVDVLVLAGLYTIRIVAGATATGLPISLWLLSFSTFFFLSLALMKRFSELQISKSDDSNKKLRGRGYLSVDFEVISTMGIASGYVSVLILGLYFQDVKLVNLYSHSSILWFTCPILLFWISRMWLLTHRGEMFHDPVYFAAKDKCSWYVIAFICAIFFIAKVY
jgi:4-hydroxybenzoate polyprenyltransferase/phosphoserine phosphatase